MIPTPRSKRLPFVGNLGAYLRDPLAFLCSMRETYGDVVDVAIGPLHVTLLSHPDLVEDVLVTRNRLWQKDRFLQQTLKPVLGEGLLSSERDFWRKQRRLAQPAFHRDRIAGYAGIMVEHARRLVLSYRDGETRDIHADMMRVTVDVVASALFGASVGDNAEDVAGAIEALLAIVSDPFELFFPILKRVPTPKRRRFDRAVARLDAIVYGVIERRRKSGVESDDLLSMLLHAEDEDGGRMSDRQLRDECLTLFLAGHETTAINLSWTFHLLSKHPAVERKLVSEIDEVLGGREATFADIPKLRFGANVVAESLRLYPPAWSMGREAREDVELPTGHRVARGGQVWFCPWAIQRDPRWFDAPNEFRPERWDGDLAKRLHRYAYFPFGGGPRFCIGESFARMEAVLILVTVLQSFRVDVLPKPRPTPAPSVTLRPKRGIFARLSRR